MSMTRTQYALIAIRYVFREMLRRVCMTKKSISNSFRIKILGLKFIDNCFDTFFEKFKSKKLQKLNKFLEIYNQNQLNEMVKIGIIRSGGGFFGLVYNTAINDKLTEIGLLNASFVNSGLSGNSISNIFYTDYGGNTTEMKKKLVETMKISKKHMYFLMKKSKSFFEFLENYIHSFLKFPERKISNLMAEVHNNNLPMPIFQISLLTKAKKSPQKYDVDLIEITPFSVELNRQEFAFDIKEFESAISGKKDFFKLSTLGMIAGSMFAAPTNFITERIRSLKWVPLPKKSFLFLPYSLQNILRQIEVEKDKKISFDDLKKLNNLQISDRVKLGDAGLISTFIAESILRTNCRVLIFIYTSGMKFLEKSVNYLKDCEIKYKEKGILKYPIPLNFYNEILKKKKGVFVGNPNEAIVAFVNVSANRRISKYTLVDFAFDEETINEIYKYAFDDLNEVLNELAIAISKINV